MNFKVVFFGTPQIAARCLQALLDSNVNVAAVVTKVDKPIGRKQIIIDNEVKQLAKQHNIKVLQPNKLLEIYDELMQIKPDLIVVCAFGKIIPEKILNIPQFHCVNIHTSLLPRWRGGAPIHHAIINRDATTGVTLMYMTPSLDAGDIIFQQPIEIANNETYRSLYDKLANLAYEVLKEKHHMLFSTSTVKKSQDESLVTIAKNISREDEKINWYKPAIDIDALIRGLYDQPIAYSSYQDMDVKIYEAQISHEQTTQPGEIVNIDKDGIYVSTKEEVIKITKLQLPSKKPMLVKDLINGNHPFKLNTYFK